MNLPTVIVLIVLALCVALALRSILSKKKRGGHCGGCSNESCGGASSPEACPSVRRALADVDAKLGKPRHCEGEGSDETRG